MRSYHFQQLDVFTDKRFEGNPLAVFTNPEGLSDAEMQEIAKEMNLSETVFVEDSDVALRRLRIFTPRQELPLAGHPVVGTWNLLASTGVTQQEEEGTVEIEQETGAGVLPVEIRFRAGKPESVTMTQGQFKAGEMVDQEDDLEVLAAALGLERDELAVTEGFPAMTVSTGIGSLAVPVSSLTALGRIKVNSSLLSDFYLKRNAVGCYAFSFETIEDTSKVCARFFAPADAIPEDPATGSAAGSLTGYLLHHGAIGNDEFVIEQGDFMGRPSRITAQADGEPGNVTRVKIGGRSVLVAEGTVFM